MISWPWCTSTATSRGSTGRRVRAAGKAIRLLLPDTADWEAWWAAQQDVAHEIDETAFSEEYALMCRDPLIPEGYRADLKQVRRHVAASDLGLLPELPPRQSFMEHDVYLEASGALPLPRALPAIRCSAGAMEVNWGDNTGEPLNTSRDNVISETDVCLQVPLPVPADMTLGHVLLSRDWRASFEQSNLGMPGGCQTQAAFLPLLLATQAAFLPLSQPLERKSTCKLWELKSWPR